LGAWGSAPLGVGGLVDRLGLIDRRHPEGGQQPFGFGTVAQPVVGPVARLSG
jgi:hypothetical protein